jgi:hypothetical protein
MMAMAALSLLIAGPGSMATRALIAATRDPRFADDAKRHLEALPSRLRRRILACLVFLVR